MAYIPQPLAGSIHAIAKKAVGRDWQLYGILLTHWAAIVGEDWADAMTPVKLTFPSLARHGGQALQDGVLTIRMPRGLAMEAQYQTPRLLARINDFFGGNVVARLVFAHAAARPAKPPPRPSPDPKVKNAVAARLAAVQDPGLREALQGLGEVLEESR